MKLRLTFFIISIFMLYTASDCKKDNTVSPDEIDYRQEMREFVIDLAVYAKDYDDNFIIIPQNGIELAAKNGSPNSIYLSAIDGNGQEDLFYGYVNDDQATPASENSYLRSFLDISKNAGNIILVTDYCSTPANIDDSYHSNNAADYVSFAADQRELNNIPNYPIPVYSENNSVVSSLANVKNFLYLINPENYAAKSDFITAVTSSNYDLLIMDLFFNDGTEFTSMEINQLKNKANGGKRLVVSYMSIGEAEDYRYYWQSDWNSAKPSWIDKENPDWAGNYKVKYWLKEWQDIIFGNDISYLKRILDADFDGVYLDIIDAFEYYE